MTDSLRNDIDLYLGDRNVTQVEIMRKHDISRNTLKKYVKYVQEMKKGASIEKRENP